MPSSVDQRVAQSAGNRGICWRAVVKTLAVEVFVLLALSAAVVGYLNWSSEAAFADFSRAYDRPAQGFDHQGFDHQGLDHHAQSSIPAAKSAKYCTWKA